jgi:LysM repeat protein
MIDVTLTEDATGLQVVLQVVPESLPAEHHVNERTWTPIQGPQVMAPKGRAPSVFTLISWLPDAHDVGMPWAPVATWLDPLSVQRQLDAWIDAGTTLHLVATDTSFDAQVYIRRMHEQWGELGRMGFELELVRGGSLIVTTESTDASGTSSGFFLAGTVVGPNGVPTAAAGDPPIPGTYVVKSGDSLSTIAALVYGDPTQWTTLYDANKAPGGPIQNPNVIQPGWSLTVPGGQPAVVDSASPPAVKSKSTTAATAAQTKANPTPPRSHREQEGGGSSGFG